MVSLVHIVGYLFIAWGLRMLAHWLPNPAAVFKTWGGLSAPLVLKIIWIEIIYAGFLIAGFGLVLRRSFARPFAIGLLIMSLGGTIVELFHIATAKYSTGPSWLLITSVLIQSAALLILWRSRRVDQTSPLRAATEVRQSSKPPLSLHLLAVGFVLLAGSYARGYTTTPLSFGVLINVLCPLLAGIGLWCGAKWGHILAVITLIGQGMLLFGVMFWAGDTRAIRCLLIIAAVGWYLLTPTILRACGLLQPNASPAPPRRIPWSLAIPVVLITAALLQWHNDERGRWRGDFQHSLVQGGGFGSFGQGPLEKRVRALRFRPYFPTYIPPTFRSESFQGYVVPARSERFHDGLLSWTFYAVRPDHRRGNSSGWPLGLHFREGTQRDWDSFRHHGFEKGELVQLPGTQITATLVPPESYRWNSVLDWVTPDGVHILISAYVGSPPAEITREDLLRIAASMQPASWAKPQKVESNLEEKILEATSEQQLRDFLKDSRVKKTPKLLLALTRNRYCSPELLRELSTESSPIVAAALIGSEGTPSDVIRKLSEPLTSGSVYSIASHPNTPPDVFRKLLDWKESGPAVLQINIAYNPSAPPDILRTISKGSNRSAKLNLLLNPNTPMDVLEALANDSDEGLRFSASRTLAKRKSVQAAPSTPPQLVEITTSVPAISGVPSGMIRGVIRYLGKPVTELTSATPEVYLWKLKDRGGRLEIPVKLDGASYEFVGVPEGKYQVIVSVNANPNNPLGLPGDYHASPNVTVNGQGVMQDIVLHQLIHLTSPIDNGQRLTSASPPVHQHRSPVEFVWDLVPGADRYQIAISKFVPGQPPEPVVAKGLQETHLAVPLEASKAVESYIFRIAAFKEKEQVGDFEVLETGSRAWHYSFQIVE